jgi:antitoxin HicB
MSGKNIGSAFDDLLKEEGIEQEARSIALKRVLAYQIAQAMKEQHISKNSMAKRMETSRTQVERLLDPTNASIQLDTLERAANIVGRRLVIDLEPSPHKSSPSLPPNAR